MATVSMVILTILPWVWSGGLSVAAESLMAQGIAVSIGAEPASVARWLFAPLVFPICLACKFVSTLQAAKNRVLGTVGWLPAGCGVSAARLCPPLLGGVSGCVTRRMGVCVGVSVLLFSVHVASCKHS